MAERSSADPAYLSTIVDIAAGLFARQGYRGTSMRDIGKAVGIHAGSLYVHIDSKEELLHRIVNSIMLRSEQDMTEILAGPGTAAEQLHEVVLRDLRLVSEHREAATVFFHEWRNLSDERQQEVIASRDRWEHGLRSVITRGIDGGEFRAVDVRITGIAITSMLNWAYSWYSPGGPLTVEQLADQYTDLVTAGLQPR
jgi:TetR/AcrR family transcriptional regulator, cholesterol catabolism regulator